VAVLPEHLSSPLAFIWVRLARFLVFCAIFRRSLFFPLSFFVVVLSALLQFTVSDNHCGIFKLFLAFLIKSSKRDVVMMCNLSEWFFCFFLTIYKETFQIIYKKVFYCHPFKNNIWPWLGWPVQNICVTNYNGYVPFAVITFQYFLHSWLINGFWQRLTRRMPPVEQELLILTEHLSSPCFFFLFIRVCAVQSLVFCVAFFTIVCHLSVVLYIHIWLKPVI